MSYKGILYVVATPIGNLQDITFRAVEILRKVDKVVCEDTRVSSILLNKYGIKKPLIALNEFNEEQTVYSILNELEARNIALISDAGTPLISDPGYRLVSQAQKKGIKVVPIPGPTALIAALSASGLPTDKFSFLGFLSKSKTKNVKLLSKYKELETTIILYESPHRITNTLEIVMEAFGDIEVTITRELTKIYEEILKGKTSAFIDKYSKLSPKGEIVILFSTKS